MNLVFEIITNSNSIYKLFSSKNNKVVILTSDSIAFKNIDFVVLKTASIKDRMSFIGTVYSDAIIDKSGKICNKYSDKDLYMIDMKNEESTTNINSIKIVNERIFRKLQKKSILIT